MLMSSPLSQTPLARGSPRGTGRPEGTEVVVRHPVDVAQSAKQAVSTAQLVMLEAGHAGTAPQILHEQQVLVSWELSRPFQHQVEAVPVPGPGLDHHPAGFTPSACSEGPSEGSRSDVGVAPLMSAVDP